MIEEDLSIAWGLEGEPLLLVAEHRIVPTEAAEREHILSSPVEVRDSDLSLPTDVFYRVIEEVALLGEQLQRGGGLASQAHKIYVCAAGPAQRRMIEKDVTDLLGRANPPLSSRRIAHERLPARFDLLASAHSTPAQMGTAKLSLHIHKIVVVQLVCCSEEEEHHGAAKAMSHEKDAAVFPFQETASFKELHDVLSPVEEPRAVGQRRPQHRLPLPC
jgi:hypothetical protein